MSGVMSALAGGLYRVLRSGRLLLLMLACNLTLAALALLPVLPELDRRLSFQGSARGLAERWPAWLDADLQVHGAAALQAMGLQAAAMVLLAAVLGAFLSAGALGVLHDSDGAFSAGGFFRGCGRYGFPFLRMLALVLAALWLVEWLLGRQLGALVEWLRFDWPSLRGAALLRLGHEVLVVVGFLAVVWTADLARARMVVEKRRSALGALLAALALALRRTPALAGIYGALALLEAVLLAAAAWLLPRLAGPGWSRLLALLIATQALVMARIGLRLARLECGRRWLLPRP